MTKKDCMFWVAADPSQPGAAFAACADEPRYEAENEETKADWIERGAEPKLVDAGMSLRDYFAAKAMHALVTEPPWGDGGVATVHAWSKDFHGGDPIARFAYVAYKMADAMLEARRTP